MNVKTLIFTVIENIIKVVILAALIMYIFKGITLAYDFGYKVFADEPMTVNSGRIITIGVSEDADVDQIAQMLEEKGLIDNAKRFVIQEYLSAYHGEIKPGIYDLSTDMTANEMIEIMATEVVNDPMENSTEDVTDMSEDEESLDDEMLEDEGDMSEVEEP